MSELCGLLSGCTNAAAAQWTRRPHADELATFDAAEQSRRDDILIFADPSLPPPTFPPLPTAEDTTVPVFGCSLHAITLDLACRVHQSTCTAPNLASLPACDCTPEPLPPADPAMLAALAPNPSLPKHWLPEAV